MKGRTYHAQMPVLRLDRDEARRIAIRAQLLGAERPTELAGLVDHLTFLQVDPTAAVAPSADLIAWSRLGSSYQPVQLKQAIEQDRTMFEHISQDDPVNPAVAMVRPMADLGLFLARMALPAQYAKSRDWLQANESFQRDILARLQDAGPLQSRDIPDTCTVPWQSTGWTHSRNVTMMLELLVGRGKVAIAGRVGRQRTWDLAERVYPAGVPVIPLDEATRVRDERRLRALGIARAPLVGRAGSPAQVEGSSVEWRVDPDAVGLPFTGRTALLSPFDRLIHDRVRALDIFEFEYVLEMYKPATARRWGYFALPVLHGDRLVDKLDAVAKRSKGTFEVHALHADVRLTAAMTAAIHREIDALATWLGLRKTGI
jgi:uncharacterized protein YcaQ